MENVRGKMAELEIDMVFIRPNSASLSDFDSHTAGDDITGSKILCGGSVTFHESFTLGIQEISSLASRT